MKKRRLFKGFRFSGKSSFSLLLCLPMLLLCLSSCDNEDGYMKGLGTVFLQLQADTTFSATAKTKATDGFDQFKNVSNYSVEISQDDRVVSSYEKYSYVPASVELAAGTYQLKAFLGELSPAKFEAPYFAGVSRFLVEANQTTNASVTCSLANTKVSVAYSEDFKEAYPDYSLAMTTAHTSEALVFRKEEARSAYFRADTAGQRLDMTLSLTSLENKKSEFKPSAITIKPREEVKLLFKADGEAVSGVKLEITIDGSTIDTTLNVGIPDYMLPLDPPSITPVGFVPGEVLEVSPIDASSSIDIRTTLFAGGTIDSFIVEINSAFLKAKGLKERYDLANLSEEDRGVLNGYFPVGGEMYRQRSYSMDLRQTLVRKLTSDSGVEGIHEFTFIVKDSLKTHQASKPVVLKLRRVDPELRLAMEEGDVWATRATIRAEVVTGNPFNVSFFAKANSASNWRRLNLLSAPTIQGKSVSIDYTGLTPNTTYSVLAVFGTSRAHASATPLYEFTTEPEAQLPNADFENWTKTTVRDEERLIPSLPIIKTPAIDGWRPYTGSASPDAAWSSTNEWTVFGAFPEGIKDADIGNRNYLIKAGVEQSGEAYSGSSAAKIFTVGWGKTRKEGSTVVGTESVTPGKLFLGTDATGETGIAFTSRPTSMSFSYKFAPLNNESFKVRAVLRSNGVDIGYTEFVGRQGQSAYRKMQVPFVYYDQHKSLRATHIYIECVSSTSGANAATQVSMVGTYPMFTGSTLYIDDINLEY